MKKLTLFVSAVLLIGALIAACDSAPATQAPIQAAVDCQIPHFEATVRQGPNAGLTLAGSLHIQADPSGSATATLTQANGPEIKAVGQVNGRAINLAFDVGGGRTVYGVGTAQNDIHQCTGDMGGPFAGPDAGDSGDWITGFFQPTPTPSSQPPVIRNPVWYNDKISIAAASSFIQNGATMRVTRSGYATQTYNLQFDDSGTRLLAGGPNNPSTPGGYLMVNFVPAGIPVTLVVVNPNGAQSAPVNFQH